MANDEAEEANETADEASSESETEMHSVKESGGENDQGENEQ